MHSVKILMPKILLIDVDSLRADHVGAYGYSAPTTPNIDELTTDGVQFDQAYSANSPCMPARAALVSGRYGIHNGIATHGPEAQTIEDPGLWTDWAGTWKNEREDAEEWRRLPEVFYDERVRTGAVTSFPRHPAPWFTSVWHELFQPQEPPGEGEWFQTPRAATVVDRATTFLEQHGDNNFFLYVQLWDPHAPFNRSEEQIARFRDTPLPPYPTADQIADHREWDAWRSASEMNITDRDDLRELLAHYDAEIRYTDHHIGRLLDCLRTRDLYDDTLIVVTADHGEEFGEHGLYQEHWSTHDGTQHIPLVIKPPADTAFEQGTRNHLVTNVDLAPTLADYAGIDTPEQWQGHSLRPVIADANHGWRDHIVIDHGLYTVQRAVRTDRWKLIRTYHPGMWDGVVPEVQLFDMTADSWEQSNTAADNPGVVEDLTERMAVWEETYQGPTEDALMAVARDGPPGVDAFGEYNGV